MLSRPLYSLLVFVCLVACAFGQTPAVPAPQTPATTVAAAQSSLVKVEMPSDPAALLALAAKRNGLQNAGSAPWHVKATYEVLDDKGRVKETGTFEEWWISEKKYKLSYTSPGFSQTDYWTDAGGFRVGDQKWPDGPMSVARNSLFPFFPSDRMQKNSTVGLIDRPAGAGQLKCVTLEAGTPGYARYAEVYCFNSSTPILRLFEMSRSSNQIVYNSIVSFRGVYVARDVLISWADSPQVRVHIDSIGGMPQIEESSFVPPPGAAPISGTFPVGASVMAGRIIRKVQPEYPSNLRSIRVQGTVVLQALIKKDGTIGDLQPISGPKLLFPPAISAIRQWVYEPYLLNGEAVEVQTEINVVFALGDFDHLK